MRLIIDIDEETYNMCKQLLGDADEIERAIANSIVLPKGHGDLIDRDVAYEEFDKVCLSWEGSLLTYVPTVIPADK